MTSRDEFPPRPMVKEESSDAELYRRGRSRIPGGTQLLSKRAEMYAPEQWPTYYSKAQGIEIVDIEGRSFKDFSMMGIGACILGYSDPDVDRAALEAIRSGVQSTLNAPEEVILADVLCDIHPWASMVRYTRSGGEAMAMTVRIARAYTGKSVVLFSGYHGWHDWYLAANLGVDSLGAHLMPGLEPAGVPEALKGTAFGFHYNRLEELQALVKEHGKDVAAIVMEPQRSEAPEPGYLEAVRALADETGATLVFDEITTGFRAHCGGVHLVHGIEPDIAVFGKAISNGYAMAAVLGREDVMEATQSTFVSSTHWTERIGPMTALATIEKMQTTNATGLVAEAGQAVQSIWLELAEAAGLDVVVSGLPCLPHIHFEGGKHYPMVTLLAQEMLKRGFLATDQFKPSMLHNADAIADYRSSLSEVFGILSQAQNTDRIENFLEGPVAKRGFYRLAR